MYNQNNDLRRNFNPKIWGPGSWDLVHLVAMSYPPNPSTQDRQNYRSFFLSLGDILPCEKCRQNYKAHCSRYNVDWYLNNNRDLLKWTVAIRNCVEVSLGGKPKFTVENVTEYYNKKQKNASSSTTFGSGTAGQTLICIGASIAALGIYML